MKYPLFYIVCFLLCVNTICKAQSMSFQINSIASTSNMTISSLPFQLDAKANCLFVSNGLSIYTPQIAKGPFKLDCIFPILYDRYGLKLYPQPIGNHPRIQLLQQNLTNTVFSIRFYDIAGRMVFATTTTGIALSSGININTGKLFPGNYIVQVLSANSLDLIQVIKND